MTRPRPSTPWPTSTRWRELVVELGWSDDRYVESMTRLLSRALLPR